MKRRSRVLIGSAATLALLAVATVLFLRYEIRKSFPKASGTLRVAGLTAPVEVRRDAYGVPHIIAANEHDLMLALGFVHAQDRLWQMELGRRAAEGRLSELLGQETVPFDRMFRIVGIRRTAEKIAASLSAMSRNRLLWYADGVNAYMELYRGSYPVEFDLLRFDPEPWTVVHSLELARIIAWELNLSWWSDLVLGEIADRVGLQKAEEIFPGYPSDVPVLVPSDAWKKGLAGGQAFLRTAREYAARTGRHSIAGGSNAWAIAPWRSATGGAVLANDTHLHLTLPSYWYEVLLRAPGYNVRGMSIPGVPGIASGRNDSIAWGVTNLMADDADFYVEQLDSSNGLKAEFEGTWYPVEINTELIQVRGDSPVVVQIRTTRHGPLISDISTPLQRIHPRTAVSMQWTGNEIDDPVEAFMTIARSTNWEEFSEGVGRVAVPGQNFVYADVRGNIGYRAGVRLPVRGKLSGSLPLPGWSKEAEWRGFVPASRLPARFNPPEGFIASANNKVTDESYPYHIGDLWEPPSRFLRLRELLGTSGERLTPDDFARFQIDKFSHQAREFTPYLLAVLADSTFDLPDRERIQEYFRSWHFMFAVDDIATTIFQQWFVCLTRNIYGDELGEDIFHDYVVLTNLSLRATTRLFHDSTSAWFDDVRTESVETRDHIVRTSLREAVANLHARLGSDTRRWRWGDIHTVTLQHPFGLRKPLDRIFNIGPYPVGGASTALISGEYSLNAPFAVTIAPSFRQIWDLGATGEGRTVLPSGQSGQVFHVHYDDQTSLWLQGTLKAARMDDSTGSWEVLRLEPTQ